MISWCSYCQKFLGDVPPYTDFSISHGICRPCAKSDNSSKASIRAGAEMRDFYADLADRATSGSPISIADTLKTSSEINIQASDLLMGIIQPILYQIGELYAEGRLRIATEHAFTMFCEELLHQMNDLEFTNPLLQRTAEIENMLFCADSNYHSLGIRFTSFYLEANNIVPLTIYPGLPAEEIQDLVQKHRPKRIGISLSMPSQLPWLNQLATSMKQLPEQEIPNEVIVGGLVFRSKEPVPLDPLFRIAPFDQAGILALFSNPSKALINLNHFDPL